MPYYKTFASSPPTSTPKPFNEQNPYPVIDNPTNPGKNGVESIKPAQDDEFDTLSVRSDDEKGSQDGNGGKHGTDYENSNYVTVYVLAYNSKMEKYTSNDVVHTATVFVPRESQLSDFDILITKMLKERFPGYAGGYECRCLKQDVLRSAMIVTKLVSDKKISAEEVTPGILLPLIGRVFVLLKAPHDPPTRRSGGTGGEGGSGPKTNISGPSPLMDLAAPHSRVHRPPWSHDPPCPPPPNFYVLQPSPAKRRKLDKTSVLHSKGQPKTDGSEQRPVIVKRVSVLPKSSVASRKRKLDEDGFGQLLHWLDTTAMSITESVLYVLKELAEARQSRRPILIASRKLKSVQVPVGSTNASRPSNRSNLPS